jgi:hypothetical protein
MDQYVKSIKNGLEESINFFGNKRKSERELWVLNEFLSYVISDFDGTGMRPSEYEPNDVVYEEVGFQVKEIQSKGRKRTREYQMSLSEITDGTEPEDLLEPYWPVHIPFNEASVRLLSELERHRIKKYYNQTSEMNVLVYLNLEDTTYDQSPVDMSLFSEEVSKWGSVSVVTNNCAIILGVQGSVFSLFDGEIGELLFKSSKPDSPE